jgi:hypothetical protein
LKANKTEISKNESPAPNHVQHLQNAESVRAEASSGDIQLSSEHLQKSSLEIQIPENTSADEEAIAEATETIQFQLEHDAIVDWQEVINLMNAYEFNDSQKTEVKRRLEAWNPAMVRDAYERTKRIEAEAAVEDPTVEGGFEALIDAFGGKSQRIELDDVPEESPLDMAENNGTDPEKETQPIPQEEEVLERNQVSKNIDALYRVKWSFGIVERCLLYVADFDKQFYTFFDTDRNNKLVVVTLSEKSNDWFEVNPNCEKCVD